MLLFKKKITILILAGFFPANIFLYSQNLTDFDKLNKLYSENNIDSLTLYLNNIYKDSANLTKLEKGKLYYIIGKLNTKKEKDDLSYKYLKKAETIFSSINEQVLLADSQYELFMLLRSRNYSFERCKVYLDKFYEFSKKENIKKKLLKAYLGYGALYFDSINFKNAKKNYEKAIFLSSQLKDTINLARAYNNKAIILSNFYNNKDSTRYFYKKALNLYEQKNRNNEKFILSLNIGTSYKNENEYKMAIKWFNKADRVKLSQYKNNYKRILYGNIADSYQNRKKYKEAYKYLELYINYKDSVNIEEQNVAIADLDKKYQTEKKEKENILLKTENKRKKIYLIGVAGTSIALLVLSYLGYRNTKRKKEIAEKNIAIEQQKFVALVKDQELISIDSMIEGQEKERKKIAEDLHDNLGSTLATLKLHFDNYRENISKKNEKQIKMLDSTEKILDEAYSKVRTMAHANQASVMAEHSLVEAVKKLAFNISLAKKTEIEVIDFGFDKSLNHGLEITLFRIVQELITNIIKHANAKKATIDLTLFDDSLGLIVEDDGSGFNLNKLTIKNKGMGLNSIKNRIEKLNGTFTIDTNINVGTTILIDIPIKKEF